MKAKLNAGLTVLVTLIIAASFLTWLSCSKERNPSNPAQNLPPTIPTAIAPADGATGVSMNFILQWSASDPENDPINYNLYFGPDSIPSHDSAWSTSTSYNLPWGRQLAARQLLTQIYVMQQAYHRQYHSFCLNGASTSAGDSTFYLLLGVVPELSDCYSYAMTANRWDFSCVASANLDYDTTNDIWETSTEFYDRDTLLWVSRDSEFPFRINTTYYWQVIAQDDHGNRATGPIWHFTTGSDMIGINNYPDVPQLLTPLDGAIVSLDTLIYTWSGSDPDGDSLSYHLYQSTSLEYLWYPIFQNIPRTYHASSWLMRVKAKEFLGQVYTLQSAYHDQYSSYCLNGAVTEYGNDGFATIGAFVDSLNGYIFTLTAERSTFICTAQANLDDDATIDTWAIDQDSTLTCAIDDFVTFRPQTGAYYWRISARDNYGHTTLSPILSFSTPGP